MGDKAERDRKEHQSKLAPSGYRVPDHFYVDATQSQESAEKSSGDGGQAASELDASDSEHGYQGKLKTPEEFADEVRSRASGIQAPANKSATPGTDNPDENAPPAGETQEETTRRTAKKTSR